MLPFKQIILFTAAFAASAVVGAPTSARYVNGERIDLETRTPPEGDSPEPLLWQQHAGGSISNIAFPEPQFLPPTGVLGPPNYPPPSSMSFPVPSHSGDGSAHLIDNYMRSAEQLSDSLYRLAELYVSCPKIAPAMVKNIAALAMNARFHAIRIDFARPLCTADKWNGVLEWKESKKGTSPQPDKKLCSRTKLKDEIPYYNNLIPGQAAEFLTQTNALEAKLRKFESDTSAASFQVQVVRKWVKDWIPSLEQMAVLNKHINVAVGSYSD